VCAGFGAAGIPIKRCAHASLAAWTSPTALISGFVFVAACGYLAAVYLTVEAGRHGDQAMRAYFTRRAQGAAVVPGALSLAALFEVNGSDPAFFSRLTGRALPLVELADVCSPPAGRRASGPSPRSASPRSSGASV
jgi:cytochrome bd-type quinol oxidase subunit 2